MKMGRLVLAVSGIICFFAAFAFANTDNKYYSEYVFKHKLNDKFDVLFTPEWRVNNDMANTYYYHWRLASVYHAHKNLDFSMAYRYIQMQDSKGSWNNNDTQYIETIFIPKVKLTGFDFSDANKFEYRPIENSRDRWVYRNLITIARVMKLCGFEFTPYVSNEIYYDFEIDKVNLNWATVGASRKVTKNVTVGLYYRDETSRVGVSNKWATAHILGSNVTVNF